MPPPNFISRRVFAAQCVVGLAGAVHAAEPSRAGRRIDLEITSGFGDALEADIRAVLLSAADALWRHCPNTRWEVPGFHIYRARPVPITLHQRRPDGRIAIGLTAEGRHWAQFAFQFAHEFAHALASHADDAQRRWIGDHGANQWFEEALCETASLFALRAMGRAWAEQAPYPNWKSYAPALTKYAQERLDQSAATLALDAPFGPWFTAELASLRQAATQRDKNLVIARQLLPLFEAHPAGWEALTALNLTLDRDPQKGFVRYLADWELAAPEMQREFIRKLKSVFN
ncbi:MAG: hypothetical protein ACKODH_11225 [Limisphaerales bacterium]